MTWAATYTNRGYVVATDWFAIETNGGGGIAVQASSIAYKGVDNLWHFGSNTLNMSGGNIATSFTSYTPTITADSGTFTTVSATGRHLTIGKLVFFQIEVTITNAGTAAGSLLATLPSTSSAFRFACSAVERTAVGISGQAWIEPSDTKVKVRKVDNSSIMTSGYVVSISGFYEAA